MIGFREVLLALFVWELNVICVAQTAMNGQPLRYWLPVSRKIKQQLLKKLYEALDGKTPSEACGITIEGQNKWKTLIQNASHEKNSKL
jgi:hypothetical protein